MCVCSIRILCTLINLAFKCSNKFLECVARRCGIALLLRDWFRETSIQPPLNVNNYVLGKCSVFNCK